MEKLAQSRDRMEADRARTVLDRLDGMIGPEIAKVLRKRPEQVRRWRGDFAHGGDDARARRQDAQAVRQSQQRLRMLNAG